MLRGARVNILPSSTTPVGSAIPDAQHRLKATTRGDPRTEVRALIDSCGGRSTKVAIEHVAGRSTRSRPTDRAAIARESAHAATSSVASAAGSNARNMVVALFWIRSGRLDQG